LKTTSYFALTPAKRTTRQKNVRYCILLTNTYRMKIKRNTKYLRSLKQILALKETKSTPKGEGVRDF
jgi:hypothetical protein